MKIYRYLLICVVASLVSCNDDFMEKYPKDAATAPTYFTTYDNFKAYAWQFYAWYSGYALNATVFDAITDNGMDGQTGRNSYANDLIVEPTGASGTNWSYSNIRTIHQMLDRIDNSAMADADKAHWRSVGYFFKAQEYFRLISFYGDVIWVDKVLSNTDDAVLYGPAMPRKEVAKKVLEMLQYAQKNIKPAGDGRNTVNLNVVNALMSRFGLFEGTWQKYHQLSAETEYKVYLQASFDASTALITAFPTVHGNYNELFNSQDLSSISSVMLFKVYYVGKNGHQINRNMGANPTPYQASSNLVQSYLCADGKTIWNSTVYEGDQTTGNATMNVEFRNRDRRLWYSIAPPYRINTTFPQNKDFANVSHTGVPEDREFYDIMAGLSTAAAPKTLPVMQWNSEIVREMPHFSSGGGRYNMSQGYNAITGGYYPWKIYTANNQASGDGNDCPIYRMGEVLVNHAEAAWELGKFDQAVADASINKLRTRAGVTAMTVASIDAAFDPKRDKGGWTPSGKDVVKEAADYEVDPVLWEIRRERRVELYCEGLRWNDLRRWLKGKYISQQLFGCYVKKADYEDARHITDQNKTPGPAITNFTLPLVDNNGVRDDGSLTEGRLFINVAPDPGWLNKYYLQPVPLNELTLNPQLKQNPGYRSASE